MRGRQSLYSAEIAERLLGQLCGGRSLRAVCRDEGMPPHGTVLQWVRDDREGFAARYRRAREYGDASTGRPPLYTSEIAQRILDQLAAGRRLMDICRDPGMPSRATVQQWASANRDGFAARYQRARQIGNARAGRPTIYTAEIAKWIIEELSEGRTLVQVCSDPALPAHATVRQWASENRDGFAARYETARELVRDGIADEILQIADGTRGGDHENIRRAWLRIKARRWLLSKMLPRHRD